MAGEIDSARSFRPRVRSALLLAGVVGIAMSLRPAITSVGPLIGEMRGEMDLSSGLAGLLTTLPLIAFALVSPVAPRVSHRIGNELTLFLGLLTTVAGIGVRSIPTISALFVGTCLVGTGIAAGNVTLPGLIKDRFPDRVGLMTGLYTTFMSGFAGVASGFSVPLAEGAASGWRGALAFWAIPAAAAALLWVPQLRGRVNSRRQSNKPKANPAALLRSPLAWQVTFFMGLQSLIFYVMVTWLPELVHAKGMSVSTAGWMLSLVQLFGLPATLLVPILADRLPDQRRLVVALCVLDGAGLAALFSGSTGWLLFAIVCIGAGQGAAISLSLTFFGLRARDAQQAADLSGMAQSVGYLMAAVGPVSFGFLHDLTGSWNAPVTMLLITCALMLVAGLGAGRREYVTQHSYAAGVREVGKPGGRVTRDGGTAGERPPSGSA